VQTVVRSVWRKYAIAGLLIVSVVGLIWWFLRKQGKTLTELPNKLLDLSKTGLEGTGRVLTQGVRSTGDVLSKGATATGKIFGQGIKTTGDIFKTGISTTGKVASNIFKPIKLQKGGKRRKLFG
jgi:hypothetical protein